MENDLNRSSFCDSGELAGRPTPEKVPRTSRADSCEPPKGNEPYYCREASAQPQGAIPVITNQAPPQEGDAAKEGPVAVPSGDLPADGSYADA
jgi:hypothetical protein